MPQIHRPTPLSDCTGFQRDLLSVIASLDAPKGLAIKAWLERYYDEDEIHHGRLYPNLDTLVERGLVEKGAHVRRTNYYTLTKLGKVKSPVSQVDGDGPVR